MASSTGSLFLVIWGTLLLSRSMRAKDNQHATQLLYMYNMFTDNFAILGHTIRSMNVSSQVDCFRHCAKVCGCVAFQLTGWKCELLDADKGVVVGDLVTRPGTALYTMNQDSIQVNQSCVNGCCRSKPCLNGGTCEEKCSDVREPYTCTCSKYYKGKRCEQFYPEVSSCQGLKIFRPGSHSGVYELVISDNKTVQSYCDFTSEAGKAWTLIESFSLSNKDIYKNKPFYHDFPRNENNFTWDDFRLSYQALVNIRDNSTHWRVTCTFPSGLSYTDYARSSLNETDLLTFVNQDKCKRYEYVSVRGINCTDCKGMLVQRDSQHMHTDSYWSGKNGCQWNPGVGAKSGEDNFGFYAVTNPKHRCTVNASSTTQWWLGSEL
ncbi:uncharacterized protein [Porites lutea]|uniref:uncharacterized protein n=1 Tax=Porites lutea TaxID=51062 RepID=UPI003CC6C119